MVPNVAILPALRFSESSYTVRVEANSVAEDLTFSVTPGRNYYMSGDQQVDAAGSNDINGEGDLVRIFEEMLETHSEITAASVDIDFDVSANTAITILWDHANTTLDKEIFGYSGDGTDGDQTPQGLWLPGRAITEDSRDRQGLVGGVARTVSGATRFSRIATPKKTREVLLRNVFKTRILNEYADASSPYNTIEWAWVNSMAKGWHFRIYDDEADISSGANYGVYTLNSLEEPFDRDSNFRVWWQVRLSCTLWERK